MRGLGMQVDVLSSLIHALTVENLSNVSECLVRNSHSFCFEFNEADERERSTQYNSC